MHRSSHRQPKPRLQIRIAGILRSILTVSLVAASGCRVPVHQQRWISKPSIQLSDSPVFNYQSRVLAQIESGAAASGGAQASGCTSCR